MTLNYDFDFFSVMPTEVFDDPELSGKLSNLGLSQGMLDSKVACFRDLKTVEALRRAPEPVREYLLNAGFGLNHYSSGAPAGRYLASDEPQRLAVIDKMTATTKNYALPKAADGPPPAGEFNLPDFMMSLVTALPLDEKTSKPDSVLQQQRKSTFMDTLSSFVSTVMKIQGRRVKFGLFLLALAGVTKLLGWAD